MANDPNDAINKAIDKITSEVPDIYRDLKSHNIMHCVINLMECAEAFPALVGADRKKVVVQVLLRMLEKSSTLGSGELEMIKFLVNSGLIDSMIEGIITITKQGCKINMYSIAKAGVKASMNYCDIL